MARFTVSPAAPHELLPACRLLFCDGAEFRCDRLLANSDVTGLFVARDAVGKLRAAALVQTMPGALGVAWPPRGDSAEVVDAVTAAACAWLRARGVKVCQAFAAAGEAVEMLPLERAGFRRTTSLVLMEREVTPTEPGPEAWPLSFELFPLTGPHLPESLRAALVATHEGTLDCPELNANRTPGELLAGFEAAPNSEFYLASRGGECVGVALFDFDPESRFAELSYFGVVPAARGRGVGGAILAHALAELAAAGCRAVTLSVDARNTPAMRLYARHGFAEHDRRAVWLANLSEPEALSDGSTRAARLRSK